MDEMELGVFIVNVDGEAQVAIRLGEVTVYVTSAQADEIAETIAEASGTAESYNEAGIPEPAMEYTASPHETMGEFLDRLADHMEEEASAKPKLH